MVDHEVEETLREIRERVRAAAPLQPPPQPAPLAHVGPEAHAPPASGGGGASEALARMEANLATTERAWSRLPPLLSYRRGAAARLELAVKRLVKRALHWFTWEQVNFNSAAHHALRDALAALSAQERQLAELRAEAEALRRRAAEAEARAEAEKSHAEAERSRAEAEAARRHAELRGEIERARGELRGSLERACGELHGEVARAGGELADLRASLLGLRAGLHAELHERLREELGGELGARAGHLAEEQRVCFRQLSLEATEAAVAHDRARRLLEARLEELERQSRER